MAYYIKDELIGVGCPRFWSFSNLYIFSGHYTHINTYYVL